MSTYKTIRDISARLLQTFKTAGVKLTEGQKSDIDGFIKSIEDRVNETKLNAIKATKKVVEENLEKEYQTVIDSIFRHQSEYTDLVGKIKAKASAISESKKLASKVDGYLSLYLEDVLPKQSIVDYNKMKKMEAVLESMKDILLVNDSDVVAKKSALDEQFKKDEAAFRKEIASLKKRLDESMARELKAKKEIDRVEAARLLNEKTDDLPVYEARKIRQRLKNASASEIKEQFTKIYEQVEKEMESERAEDELTLEDEIKNIVSKDKTPAPEKKNLKEKRDKAANEPEEEAVSPSKDSETADESSRDDLVVEKIDSSYMSNWIRTFNNRPYKL